MEARLNFTFSSYWHAGSGRGRDAVLDAEVLRDADDLPYLPGKTIKGLLRKAMKVALHARQESLAPVADLFGSEVAGEQASDGDEQIAALEGGRFGTTAGKLWFGSATLPPSWAAWRRKAKADRNGAKDDDRSSAVLDTLFRVVASTAIDARGVAREHTLRVSEVTVPMTLTAVITGPDDGGWVPLVKMALPHLRMVGVRGRRGYGRVEVTLDPGHVAAPAQAVRAANTKRGVR